MSETLTLRGPDRPFRARVRVPGDKSLSHRALILAGMAEGESRVSGRGPGADVASTASVLRELGVQVDEETVRSPGVEAWREAGRPLDAGNSATTLRLLAGALSGRPFRSTLVGDESLMRRPMERLIDPLGALGAAVEVSAGGTPPVTVGGGRLRGAAVIVPLASAQVRSAVELAALQAEGPSVVEGPPGFRDHTERWLAALGRGRRLSETAFEVQPGPVPAAHYAIPGDPSSAAFLWAAAALVPGARVTVEGVSLNPGRVGFLEVLERMGAEVEREITGSILDEPVGVVTVTGRGLQAVAIGGELTVRSLDELPLVGVLAGAAEGTTTVSDAGELRVKESDRIASTVALVRSLGGEAEEAADGFVVLGSGRYRGGTVDPRGDHRLAMAAAAAATVADGPVTIRGAEVASVSWPSFYRELEAAWSSP